MGMDEVFCSVDGLTGSCSRDLLVTTHGVMGPKETLEMALSSIAISEIFLSVLRWSYLQMSPVEFEE